MKKRILFLSLIVLTLIVGFSLNNNETFSNLVESKLFYSGEESVELTVGTYTSSDGHTITVGEDNTVKYDDTYTLTATASDRGYVISGKIGTNNKAVTFYQLNDSKIVSGGVVSNTHSGRTVYLYDYTVFSMDVTPVIDENGVIEVYHDNNLVNKYSDLQSAVDSASSGDTIKITSDMDVVGGAYINKDLTIDGNGKKINRATWANSIFVVEENATLTIKNLTIDGGATGFEIDYSISYPTVKAGTLDNDPLSNESAIISKGTLNINDVVLSNHYTTTSNAATVRIVSGSATLKNTDFIHNYGKNCGAAVNIGSGFKVGQTTQPVKDVVFEDCEFKDNYTVSGNGGAVFIVNAETVNFNRCYFYRNMASAYTAGGGAILIYRSGVKPAETNNLPYTQAYFDECVFEENYSGNDGYAIQNESAELYITNSSFVKNVGLSSGSSVGTVSCMLDGNRTYKVRIEESLFDGNVMGASVFGDHGTLVDLEMNDVEIKNNTGSMSILLYSANAKFTDVTFTNETVSSTCLDVRPYVSETKYPLYKPQTVVLDNVQFNDTNGPTDVLVRKRNHDANLNTATLVIEDNVVGNVNVWDNTFVTVNGDLTGDIVADSVTPSENIEVKEDAEVNGNVVVNENTFIVNFKYPVDDGTSVKFLYLENGKVYTEKELFMMHLVGKEDAKLAYYTDAAFTTEWNYTATANMSVYAKFVEHEHAYDGSLVLHDNAIHEQCSCGYLGKKLSLSVPSDLYYSGNKIEIVVDNELNLEGYTVSYQAMDKDGNFVDMEGVPTKIGTYKAILTYDDMSISSEYSIIEKPVNPSTGIITPYIICGLITIVGVVGTILYRKKKFM